MHVGGCTVCTVRVHAGPWKKRRRRAKCMAVAARGPWLSSAAPRGASETATPAHPGSIATGAPSLVGGSSSTVGTSAAAGAGVAAAAARPLATRCSTACPLLSTLPSQAPAPPPLRRVSTTDCTSPWCRVTGAWEPTGAACGQARGVVLQYRRNLPSCKR